MGGSSSSSDHLSDTIRYMMETLEREMFIGVYDTSIPYWYTPIQKLVFVLKALRITKLGVPVVDAFGIHRSCYKTTSGTIVSVTNAKSTSGTTITFNSKSTI